jgi:hypothetical protein
MGEYCATCKVEKEAAITPAVTSTTKVMVDARDLKTNNIQVESKYFKDSIKAASTDAIERPDPVKAPAVADELKSSNITVGSPEGVNQNAKAPANSTRSSKQKVRGRTDAMKEPNPPKSLATTAKATKNVFQEAGANSRKSFSHLFLRGTKISGQTTKIFDTLKDAKLTIDIISTGSKTNPALLEGQASAYSIHPSVRFFFGLTEEDDADPTCAERLTYETMAQISEHCVSTKIRRRHKWWKHSDLMKFQTNHFLHGKYMEKKNPGWLCAQKRPAHGLGKLGKFYRQGLAWYNETLPDYLLIVDDDTYINLQWFEQEFGSQDSNIPRAEAGCLIFSPFNNTFPFGGFGTILSKGAIHNLIRPIQCKDNSTIDAFSAHACHQLEKNLIGEQESFQDGMSISDLMNAHASRDNYADFPDWSASYPYCLHSDWATGFYTNFYQVSNHITDFVDNRPEYEDWPMYRLGWSLGRWSLRTNNEPFHGVCLNEGPEKCKADAQICHRLSAENMTNLALSWKR